MNFRILVWLLATTSAHVAAQTAPGPLPECALASADLPSRVLLEPQPRLQERLQALDAMAEPCLNHPAFHAQRGVLLRLLGNPGQAIEALERSLLLAPEQPGTQLDYALALRDAGDLASANALLLALSERDDLPFHLKSLLQGQLAAMSQATESVQHRVRLSTSAGIDSNLNNAPSGTDFTLTFPWGNANLALEEDARMQSGVALLNSLQWQVLKPMNGQLWALHTELRTRHTDSGATAYQQLDISGLWQQSPSSARQWIARLARGGLAVGGTGLQQTHRAALQHQWRLSAPMMGRICRTQAGLELERRNFPVAPIMNGRFQALMVSMVCEADSVQTGSRLSFQLRQGVDRAADSQRPGGDGRLLEWRAGWGRSGAGYEMAADYSISAQQDGSGYSPVLSNNSARRTLRQNLHLELAGTVGVRALGGAQWFIASDSIIQGSNLAPFATRGNALYTGLRWSLL